MLDCSILMFGLKTQVKDEAHLQAKLLNWCLFIGLNGLGKVKFVSMFQVVFGLVKSNDFGIKDMGRC